MLIVAFIVLFSLLGVGIAGVGQAILSDIASRRQGKEES